MARHRREPNKRFDPILNKQRVSGYSFMKGKPMLTHRKLPIILLTAILLQLEFACSPATAPVAKKVQEPAPAYVIDSLSIIRHINFLADDSLQGRFPGTHGDSLAENYIRRQFRDAGIKAISGPDYDQDVTVTTGVKLGRSNHLVINGENLRAGRDFIPYGFSGLGNCTAEAVFGGFGETLPNGAWNDFASINVKGKWVILLPGPPPGMGAAAAGTKVLREKVERAQAKGAAGVIISDPENSRLPDLAFDPVWGASTLPVLFIKSSKLEMPFIETAGITLSSLLSDMRQNKQTLARTLKGVRISATVDLLRETTLTHNLIGLLEGSDPDLKHEFIVIGAHKDGLGLGGPTSEAPGVSAVHNGADDNASGTACVIELANYFAAQKARPRHSLLFICFAAEEMGALGSSYYTAHPLVPNDSVDCMINLDMIGRPEEDKLIIFGSSTSPDFQGALTGINHRYGFDLAFNTDIIGVSDHSSFYDRNIPVLFFFTGTHDDYHRPSDDALRIHAEGEAKIVNYVKDLISWLDSRDRAPEFQRLAPAAAPAPPGQGRAAMKVSLGITPDFASTVPGLGIKAVAKDKSAYRAGILSGDLLTEINGRKISGIREYMTCMQEFNPGDSITVTLIRNGRIKHLQVHFETHVQE